MPRQVLIFPVERFSIELDFVWVAVSEMENSVKFCNEIWDTEPASLSKRMAYYGLENIGFGLYNSEYDGWTPRNRGDNIAPAFRVENLDSEKERIRELACEVEEYDAGDHRGFLF